MTIRIPSTGLRGMAYVSDGGLDSCGWAARCGLNSVVTFPFPPLIGCHDVASQLAEELDSACHVWNEVITGRSDSSVWPLIEYCASHLAITATSVADDLEISDVAAQNAIDRFAAWGIVNRNSETRRNRIWLVSDDLDAVEAFMARARSDSD